MKVLCISLMCGDNGFTKAFINNVDEFVQLKPYKGGGFNAQAQAACIKLQPDLVFIQIQAEGIISEHTARILRINSGFVMNFTGDVRHPIPQWYKNIGKNIDLTCFSNMNDVKEFKQMGLDSEYLEIGFDPEIYTPKGTIAPTKDIVFMGNNYGDGFFPESGYRIELVKFLKANYPNRFALYGNGWVNADGNVNSSQHEEAKVIRGANIAINLSHYNYERYNSDRILRIMGTGTMCLSRNYKGIKEDFSPGINLAVWDNFEELKNNIDFYLENEVERKEIAEKGLNLMLESFTFDAMVKNILKLIK